MAVKVGDWVVIRGLSDYKNFQEGQITRVHKGTSLADIFIEDIGVTWTLNLKYFHKVEKSVSREECINAALDLKIKDWFMELTSK